MSPGQDDPKRVASDLEAQDVQQEAAVAQGGIFSIFSQMPGEVYAAHPEQNAKWYQKLLDLGIEENGIKPVPVEFRTQTRYSDIFTVFFACLLNILP